MTIAIIAAVIGLVSGTAAIVVPRLVNRRNRPEDQTDSQAYLAETGRSAEEVERDNREESSQRESQ